MFIHVAVCGIGLGHASRSLVVARELMRRGHGVSFSAYGQAVPYLERMGFSPSRVPGVRYGVGEDGVVSVKKTIKENITLPARFLTQVGAEVVNISETGADCVVSDTRASAVAAAKLMNKPVATILNQYNLLLETRRHRRAARLIEPALQAAQLVWDSSDVIIVPDLPPPDTISEATLNFPQKVVDRVLYVGPLVDQPTSSEPEMMRIRREYGGSEKPLVLINVSGGLEEKRRLVEKFLEIAPRLSSRFSYVLSTAQPGLGESFRVGPIYVSSWVDDLDSLMIAADLVVGRSGLTLITKCMAYGKKMLLIPTPQHGEQTANALKARGLGFAELLEQDRLNASVFESIVSEVLSNDLMGRAAETLQRRVWELGGARRAAEAVERLVLNLS
ncbi:MAG: glycosyltransferase family protein [Candidatus Caldarchaeum sp.]